MARLFLSPGQTYGTVGGFSETDVIGTNDFETVFVSADGDAVFDPSFNRGGDTICIDSIADIYTATLSGSNVILTANNGAFISIPVGMVGATVCFGDDDDRLLIFDGTNVTLGGQTITTDGVLLTPTPVAEDPVFTASTAAGADVLGITGTKSVRVDLTPTHDQITGVDYNGDGVIAPNGVENNPTTDVDGIDFEIIDAYLRDHLNYYNSEANFLGNLYVDGTGFAGDGIKDGNIILGGLGADIIFGGIGNDFIAGGGVAPTLPTPPTGDPVVDALNAILQSLQSGYDYDYKSDTLSGGRNADFFFAEFSTLSEAAGDALFIDAGTTADDTSAATGDSTLEGFVIPFTSADQDYFFYYDYNDEYENHNYYPISSQDSDWFLPEVADDEEPIVIQLREGDAGNIFSEDQVSKIYANIFDIENLDASGNVYGFVDDLDVALGENGMLVDWSEVAWGAIPAGVNYDFGTENVGIGSSAQMLIDGSYADNTIIGGYDNDRIYGQEGNDLLFGGNLRYALNNPNAAGIVNDGIDEIHGGRGNDDIVYEADSGLIQGGYEYDTLWLTNQSLGWNNATQSWQTADNVTTDGVLRFDLEADGLEDESDEFGFQTAGYGGADVDGTQDQTNFGGDGVNPNAYRVEVTMMNAVDATGMGAVDYVAAGGNPTMNPDPEFRNQQNNFAYQGDLDLRGTMDDNDLFASSGNDVLEGRKGDDWLMGGAGTDDFIFAIDGDTIYDMETDGLGEDFSEGKANQPYDICDLGQLPYDMYGEDECNYQGSGDGVNSILRKYDANGDNIWDTMDANFIATYGEGDFVGSTFEAGQDVITNLGNRYWDIDGDGTYDLVAFGVAEDMDEQPFPQVLWSQDFGLDDVTTGNPSFLTIDFGDTNFSDPNVLITNFAIEIGGEDFAVNAADLADVESAAEIAAIVNARFSLQDSDVSVVSIGNTLLITDAAGRDMSDELSEGFQVSFALSNSFSEVFAMFSDQPPTIVEDRIIFKAYEDRSDNELVDDDGITGSLITLGHDGYAEDLVVGFDKDGTRLSEDQFFTITFGNLTTEDKVTITINGVDYCLQVGVNLDGTQVDAEDGVLDDQEDIQTAFLERMVDFINTFMDDDTAAGSICAELVDDRTIRISQHLYAGEETVFIHTPTVAIENLSGGETAFAEINNETETEVFLFGFDGRDGNLTEDNVQFVGQEDISRSDLETADNNGDTLTGKEAVVIDAHTDDLVNADGTDIPVNVAIDDELNDKLDIDEDDYTDNFSVHGDDNLITGDGDDTVDGRTGDDFVRGSLGADELDGGNDWYAVKYVGESSYRVTYLSAYEAWGLDGDPDVADIRIIRQTENGLNTIGGTGLQPVPSAPYYTAYFSDTLQYQQEDIDAATGSAAGTARFYVELDDFIQQGGAIILNHGGAGHVTVDADGDGSIADDAANYQHFQNFENVRTVSGIGKAVAGNGQGHDTLDLSALSDIADHQTGGGDTVADIGICYDLTNEGSAGGVYIIEDYDNNDTADGTRLVMRVDGVENVYFGDGDDTIAVDESEVAKDNIFDGDDGEDTVEYYNYFGPGNLTLEPMLTLVIESSNDTDQAIFTGGRLGTVVATDTLISFENIGLYLETARSPGVHDVLDVSNVSSDVTIDLHDGEIYGGSELLATILGASESWAGIVQFENFVTDGGDDLVIVADAEEMCCNTNSDDNNPIELEFDTYMNYDALDPNCVRETVADMRANDEAYNSIPEVTNFALFTFDLGDGDHDRVDYSEAYDSIAALVKVQDGVNYVFVDDDQNHNGLNTNSPFDSSPSEDCDRVDALIGVEEIVAANIADGSGDSLLDFTQFGMDSQITFQYDEGNISGFDYESIVRIADGEGDTVDGIPAYVEKYRLIDGDAMTPDGPIAVWNRIEGGDFGETVIYEGPDDVDPVSGQPGLDHRYTNDTLNLRGGDNEVHYNPYNTSINTSVVIVPSSGTGSDASSTGMVFATNTFTDGTNPLPGGGTHEISSYTVDNKIAAGHLRIQASQDQEDTITFSGSTALAFGLTGELIIASIDIGGTATETARFTGYEFIEDNGSTDDCYDITDYLGVMGGVQFIDNGGFSDHDTVKVHNDYFAANPGSTISMTQIESDFALDFDVLDVSAVTAPAFVNASGSGGPEEIVIGSIVNLANINGFDGIVLTQATLNTDGTSITIDTTTNQLIIGGETLQFDGDWDYQVSLSGTTGNGLGDPCADSWIASVTSGVTVTTIGNGSAEIFGGDGNDSLTGAGGADTLYGGLGADVLDGNFIAAVPETMTLTLTGNVADNDYLVITGPGGTLEVGPSGSSAEFTLATATIDEDQIGTFLDGLTNAQLETELGYGVGTIANSSYNAGSNTFTITFNTGLGNQTDITAAVNDGGDGLDAGTTLTPATGSVSPVAQMNSADTYLYCSAAESTQASMDSILHFDINNGTNDRIDISEFYTDTADNDFDLARETTTVANFAAAQAQADSVFASSYDGLITTDGTNAWLFVDANQNNDLDANDMVIMLAGVTSVSAFDFDNLIHGVSNGSIGAF